MRASAIKHLAVSAQATRVVAALSERTVQIWDLQTTEMISELQTPFSSGGNRLALSPRGNACVTAGWKAGKNGGVSCCEADSGRIMWHRTDLKETKRVRFSSSGESVWCVPSDGTTLLLDSSNGKTLESLRGLTDVYDSPYSAELLIERRERNYFLRTHKNLEIPRLTFAILNAAFGPESLCISEAVGLVRCFETSNGSERWRYDPGKGRHLLRLWHRDSETNFYGVQWEYEHGSFRTLVRLDGRNGRCTELCQLASWAEEYCVGLDCLITSSGEVLALPDGRLVKQLSFPQMEYPDEDSNGDPPNL